MTDDDGPRIDDLIERSSLGEVGAQRLRDRTSAAVVREILADDPAETVRNVGASAGDSCVTDRIAADLSYILDRAGLEEIERNVLILRVRRGYSAEETGSALGLRAGAVRRIQHRALVKIRKNETILTQLRAELVGASQVAMVAVPAQPEDLGGVAVRDADVNSESVLAFNFTEWTAFPTSVRSEEVDAGIARLRQAVELAVPGDPRRVFCVSGLALWLLRRHELTNAADDLHEARTLVEEARPLAGGPQYAEWQLLNEMHAHILTLFGDEPDGHQSVLQGLHEYVWRVLLQPDLTGVTAAARDAGTAAVHAARLCLANGDPAGAIAALEMGRGLALFAATAFRGTAARLDEAGAVDLAQRWQIAAAARDPQQLSGGLRREVLSVLSAAHSSVVGLLNPPGLGEIQDALVATDADALVYLVPAAASGPGYAVIAPAVGPPTYLALPNLVIEDEVQRRYLDTLAREADPSRKYGSEVADELADILETLGAWAWEVAIRPVIEGYLSRLPPPASGRPPHVVLVPIGDLARVPWQSSRSKDGIYIVELIAISLAASARMLCRSSTRAAAPRSSAGLLVGDPDTTDPTTLRSARDLQGARLDAFAIWRAFYPGGRYVGRHPDGSTSPGGAGTSEQVLAWLNSAGPDAGALLHLACHGVVQADADTPTTSLLLADGDKLTPGELMARAPYRSIDTVVLAACRTSVSISNYDEAYSLATSFLAGGARSVISTQWSVPDTSASALMFVFHHKLRGGLTVGTALREAQLWMLNPDREIPDEMPAPLRKELRFSDLSKPRAWAGFTHAGR